jgi:hypothetical protein
MHKTFTDCYFAKGFIGGGWGYALNSNDANGELKGTEKEASTLAEEDRTLGFYCIGWDHLEVSGTP